MTQMHHIKFAYCITFIHTHINTGFCVSVLYVGRRDWHNSLVIVVVVVVGGGGGGGGGGRGAAAVVAVFLLLLLRRRRRCPPPLPPRPPLLSASTSYVFIHWQSKYSMKHNHGIFVDFRTRQSDPLTIRQSHPLSIRQFICKLRSHSLFLTVYKFAHSTYFVNCGNVPHF